LKQCIPEHQGTEDRPHLNFVEPIFRHDVFGGDGDIDSIKVGHDAEDHQHEEIEPGLPLNFFGWINLHHKQINAKTQRRKGVLCVFAPLR